MALVLECDGLDWLGHQSSGECDDRTPCDRRGSAKDLDRSTLAEDLTGTAPVTLVHAGVQFVAEVLRREIGIDAEKREQLVKHRGAIRAEFILINEVHRLAREVLQVKA